MSEEKPAEKTHHKPSKLFLNGLFIGALIGAGAFYLVGTKKGKQSRKELLDKGKKILSHIEELIDELESHGESLEPKAKKLKKEVTSATQKTSKAITKLKKKFFLKGGKKLK